MGANTLPTVAYVAQTNRDAYLLHDYLPKKMLKPDSTILTKEEIAKESKARTFLYVARQVAGLPTLILAPTSYIYSGLGGLAAGTIGGIIREIKWPSQDPLSVQWKKWMECTTILDPKYAKLEKTIEGVVVISNGVLAWVYVPETGLYSGFTFGATHGWSVGRWIAQKITSLCSKKEDPSPSDNESSPVQGIKYVHYQNPTYVTIEELVQEF